MIITSLKTSLKTSQGLFEAAYLLNQANVPHVGEVSRERFQELIDVASHAWAVVEGEVLIASLIAFTDTPTTHNTLSVWPHKNFAWFQAYGLKAHEQGELKGFVYVDRVAVAEGSRGRGVGRSLYTQLISELGEGQALCAEVNLLPERNEGSLAFHARLGFTPLADVRYSDDYEVRMLAYKRPESE